MSVVLPAPLRPDQADLVARGDAEGDVLHQEAGAGTNFELLGGDHEGRLVYGSQGTCPASAERFDHGPRRHPPMRFNPKARLDTGQVSDGGRGGGGGMGGGGMRIPIPGGTKAGGGIGGILIIILFVVLTQCTGRRRWRRAAQRQRSRSLAAAGRHRRQRPLRRVQDRCRRQRERGLRAGGRGELDPGLLGGRAPRAAGQQYAMSDTHTFTGQTGTGCGTPPPGRAVLLSHRRHRLPRHGLLRPGARASARWPRRRLRRGLRPRLTSTATTSRT